jgi:hypothetical protein
MSATNIVRTLRSLSSVLVALVLVGGCSAEQADEAEQDQGEVTGTTKQAVSGCPSGALLIYWDGSFQGATRTLCEGSISDLRTLHRQDINNGLNPYATWNDEISSFIIQGSTSTRPLCAKFYRDVNYGGPVFACGKGYGCGVQVPYVGDYYNDTFSSVKFGPC